MSEFSMIGGVLGRSIHDAPERTQREIEDERMQDIIHGMSAVDLQRALIRMIRAAREAEGAALSLDRELGHALNNRLKGLLDTVTDELIGEGIDHIDLILGDGALEALESHE